MKSDLIDIDVECTARTEKAVWLPMSMIEMDPDDTVSGTAIMTLPESGDEIRGVSCDSGPGRIAFYTITRPGSTPTPPRLAAGRG